MTLPYQVNWTYEFHHSVDDVWPWVANTDRMNRAAGLPAITYREEPDPRGGSRRYGSLRFLGLSFGWLEHPYQWLRTPAGSYYEVERDFSSGPLKKVLFRLDLTPTSKGCQARITISFEPKLALLAPLAKLQLIAEQKKGFLKAYAQLDRFLDQKSPEPFLATGPDRGSISESLLHKLSSQMQGEGVGPVLAAKLAEWVLQAQEPDLARIRPFVLAEDWDIDRHEIVAALLKATRAGIFELSWELLCPSCRGGKNKTADLSGVSRSGHCDSCNVDFEVDFDQSVEVTFQVSPGIRKISAGSFCVGGPLNTPHYLFQQRLAPAEKKVIQVQLAEAGVFSVRSLQSKKRAVLESGAPEGVSRVEVHFAQGEKGGVEKCATGLGLVEVLVENQTSQEILCIFERSKWLENACTAAFVTSLQEFRDLFSAQVLRPGQEISVKGIALLFTDLKGSTSMYHRIGDATAFSLVRDHFDILIQAVRTHEGALVKTIGDAVMAAFTQPQNAVKAAIEIHRRIEERNDEREVDQNQGERLKLKIGIHFGPCFAVSLNERLDYFGSTVNIAARTEGQCEGGDIVISKRMMSDPDVAAVVKQSGYPLTSISRNLKGFDEHFELFKIQCVPN